MNQLLDKIINNKKYHFGTFLIVLVLLTAVMMICYRPLCPGQDFQFHFSRFMALIQAMQDGNYPFYIDNEAIDGYGYLARVFYPDLILLPFAFIGMITSASTGYLTMIFTMTLLCGLFTYLTVNRIYKRPIIASLSAILYTFCTYRLLDVYHRAALGEALSFTFLPLVFLGLYHIIRGDYKKWYILAIGYSLMIYTHLISSVLMCVTIFVFLLVYNKSLRAELVRIKYLVVAVVATVILTAYYLFPMLEQMLDGDFYYKTNNIMVLAQDSKMGINWLFWGLLGGGVQPRQVFIPGIGILLTAVVCVRLFVRGKSQTLRSADVLVIIGLFYLLAISQFFPWQIVPFSLLNFIQLPWRLFEFIAFFFAVAGSIYIVKALETSKRISVAFMLIFIVSAFTMASDGELYKGTRCLGDVNESATVDNNYHMGGLEYIPSAVPSINFIAERGRNTIEEQNSDTIITHQQVERAKGHLKFTIASQEINQINLPLLYYKGYKASLNGNEIDLVQNKNGLVQLNNVASGEVDIYYAGTGTQKGSLILSCLGLIAILATIVYSKKKKC